MNQTQQIKKIVAVFLKTDEDLINFDTVIDRSAIKGSIMIHRMYAAIARELKCEIKDFSQIKTFSDLLKKVGLGVENNGPEPVPQEKEEKTPLAAVRKNISIGIDMEEVDKLPRVTDFREDFFYKQNFSPKEIAYCLSQPDPVQSFAGKFAAKEAIVKADNSYKSVSFCQIEIEHDGNGSPYFRNFMISISHTDKLAVAVAIRML